MLLPARLRKRKSNSHKGDFGHIFILAGSSRFSGAAVLCAQAAMRSGAGLVTLGIPKGINSAVIKKKPDEVMTLPLPETKEGAISFSGYKRIKEILRQIDVLVIGPGLGREKTTQKLVRKILKGCSKPVVIDADGLNALVGHLNLLPITGYQLPVTKILTPHPGEMARLLGVGIDKVQKNRKEVAKTFAKDYNIILVLKGQGTIVTDGRNCYINKTGNPGMSTAGCGDVLTGIIAAFLAQGLEPFAAAKFGVYLHGLAGDLAAEEKTQISMIASDIIEKLTKAIKLSS